MTVHDFSDIEPVPADWFSPKVSYEGEGRATFGDPPSVVSGHVVVSCDEYGNATARMAEPAIVSSERESSDASELFLSMPTCLSLTVTTADGRFDAGSRVFYDYEDANLFHAPEDTSTVALEFHWLRAQFARATPGEAKYWVLPLLNFLFSPNQRIAELDRHPLRVYPTPVVSADADESRALLRRGYAHQKNRLAVFECNGRLGFIERLPDYDARRARLAAQSERRLLTAVMVGTVGGASETWEALEGWFPFDLLALLGVASGAKVGAPWVEFRDAQGALVCRWHASLGTPDYHRGHVAIHEAFHEGIGQLVTRACAAEEFGSIHLRVAMRHLVDGLAYEQPIEERLGHFCRAIDGLCKAYGLTGHSLLDEVRGEYRGRVKKAIAEAAHAIEAIAAEAAAVGEFADGMMLKQIAERTRSSPAYVDYNFGNAAIRLMERFGLADPDVMAQFLAGEDGNVAEGRRKWSERLSDCRGITMHGGYFDLRGGTHDSQFLWQTAQHLLDILLRIVLKALQYGGTYQPSAARDLSPQPLDWVGPQTPPRTLGYR